MTKKRRRDIVSGHLRSADFTPFCSGVCHSAANSIINTVGAGNGGCGIGTGQTYNGRSCTITINGGTVTTAGRANYGAGIGCILGTITITGGTVNATGCSYAPGIGSGGISANSYQVATEIIISGGKVNAREAVIRTPKDPRLSVSVSAS